MQFNQKLNKKNLKFLTDSSGIIKTYKHEINHIVFSLASGTNKLSEQIKFEIAVSDR